MWGLEHGCLAAADGDFGHFFEAFDVGLGAFLAEALLGEEVEELAGDGGDGHGEFHFLGCLVDEALVFEHELDGEAGVEVALEDAGAEVFELPGVGGAAGDGLEDFVHVHAGLRAEKETFADGGEGARDHDLVDQFAYLAHAAGADVDDVGSHCLEDG